MPDDLDLRDLHGRHEPDPAFRAALRRRVEAVVAGSAAIAPAHDHPNEEERIMLTDTRTENPTPSPPSRRWLPALAAAAVVVAVVAGTLVARSGDGSDGEETPVAGTGVTFQDVFDDDAGEWEDYGFSRIEDGEFVWTITTPGQSEFLKPLANDARLVDMEVTATVVSVDPDSTVGVDCRKGPGDRDFLYSFRVSPSAVTIGVLPDVADAPGEELATAAVERPAGPFELTGRCVDVAGVTELTMLIDGDVVLEATYDTPIPAGFGALEAQAGAPGSAASEVRWDDVSITALS